MGYINKEVNDNSEVVNRLLLDMNKSLKDGTKNLVKVFIITIICYTILLVAMVVGFFVYESQFEVVDGEYEYSYEQQVDGDSGSIINGNQYNGNSTHNGN